MTGADVDPTGPTVQNRRRSGRVSVHFACPRCERTYILPVPEDTAPGAVEAPFLTCEICGFPIQFQTVIPGPDRARRGTIERCAFCGNREFYTQKDFNRKLGLWLVVVSGMCALLVMVLTDHLVGLVVLLAVTLTDALIFKLVREVAVCYMCHAIYRGYPGDPGHKPFSLASDERYKKLRQDWLKSLENPKSEE